MQTSTLHIIGRNALIRVGSIDDVPAKVDTGADSSAIWASNVFEGNGELHFVLFDADSDYYTGEEIIAYAGRYEQVRIASSSGTRQIRYAVLLPVTVEGKQVQVRFTLAERSTMAYPVLLGRNFLAGQFLVDVTKHIPEGIDQALHQQKRARKRVSISDKE